MVGDERGAEVQPGHIADVADVLPPDWLVGTELVADRLQGFLVLAAASGVAAGYALFSKVGASVTGQEDGGDDEQHRRHVQEPSLQDVLTHDESPCPRPR